jgi:hypothetical protein
VSETKHTTWTIRPYGYEQYAVENEYGHQVAFTHSREYARLIAAAVPTVRRVRLKECLPLFDMVTALDDPGSNALGQAENLIRAALSRHGEGDYE